MERRSKIVITIGPASSDPETIQKLFIAGANVVRLNFSHGNQTEHAKSIADLRRISQQIDHPITIMQDLQGPKIRTGSLAQEPVRLVPGNIFTLTTQPVPGDNQKIQVDYPELPRSVKVGGRILLDDGQLELEVLATGEQEVTTKVILGGELKAHKGVNLPGCKLDMCSFTNKDESDLAFGLAQGVDAVALSFVRRVEDIQHVRQVVARLAPERANTPLIAKLERPEALDNLEEIIREADGVMVARGDLGVEMPPEMVPVAQKRIIATANRLSKYVITATQMLDSMIEHPRPTRAEASDVANAIFDGSDAVMLSGETAIGKYPLKAVQMMDAIIRQAESQLDEWGRWEQFTGASDNLSNDALSITRAARELAHDLNVRAIAVFTQTGRTAHLMSKARPRVPILAFTPVRKTFQLLPMLWGVIPFLVPFANTLEDTVKVVEDAIARTALVEPGQQVVLISGFPLSAMRPPNLAILHTIGSKRAEEMK